jgi:hypothetical protein
MGVLTVFRSDGESVDGRIARNVEIDILLKIQATLDFVAQIVEVAEQVFIDLHAMAFHTASPILIVRGSLGILEDEANDIALKGIINLAGKRLLQFNLGFEDPGHSRGYVLGYHAQI